MWAELTSPNQRLHHNFSYCSIKLQRVLSGLSSPRHGAEGQGIPWFPNKAVMLCSHICNHNELLQFVALTHWMEQNVDRL